MGSSIPPGGGPTVRITSGKAEARRDEFDELLTELEGYEKTPDTGKSERVKEILGLLKTQFNVDVVKGTILVGTTPHKVEVYAGSKWVKARELPSYAERAKLLFAHVDLFTKGLEATKGKGGKTFDEGRGQFEWTKGGLAKGTVTAGATPFAPTWAGRFRQIFTFGQQSAEMPGKKASTDLVKKGVFTSETFEDIAESVQDLGVNLLGVQHPTDRLRDRATDVAVEALAKAAPHLERLVDNSHTPSPVKEMYQVIESLGRLSIPPNLLKSQKRPTGGAEALQFLLHIVQSSTDLHERIEAKSLLQKALTPLTKALENDRSWRVSTSAYDLTKIDETASEDKLKGSLTKALKQEIERQAGFQEDAVIPIWANWALANKSQLETLSGPNNPRIKSLFDALKAFAQRSPPLDVAKDYEEIKEIFQPLIQGNLDPKIFNRHIVTAASGNRAINQAVLESTLQDQLGRYILGVNPSQPLSASPVAAPKPRSAATPSLAAQAAPPVAALSSVPISIPAKPLTDSELSRLTITPEYKNALAKSVKDWVDLNSAHLPRDMKDGFNRAVTDLGFDNGTLQTTNRDKAINIVIKHLSLPGQLISIEAVPEALNRKFLPREAVASSPEASTSPASSMHPAATPLITTPGTPQISEEALNALNPSSSYKKDIKKAIVEWADGHSNEIAKLSASEFDMALLNIASDAVPEAEERDLDTIIRHLSKPDKLVEVADVPRLLDQIFLPKAEAFASSEDEMETGREWMALPSQVRNPEALPRRDSLESTGSTGSIGSTNTNVTSDLNWAEEEEEGAADAGRPRSSSEASRGSAETTNTNTEGEDVVPPPTRRGEDDGKKPSGP